MFLKIKDFIFENFFYIAVCAIMVWGYWSKSITPQISFIMMLWVQTHFNSKKIDKLENKILDLQQR